MDGAEALGDEALNAAHSDISESRRLFRQVMEDDFRSERRFAC
jgi:hypothetical protein